jgi:hypothetical protein
VLKDPRAESTTPRGCREILRDPASCSAGPCQGVVASCRSQEARVGGQGPVSPLLAPSVFAPASCLLPSGSGRLTLSAKETRGQLSRDEGCVAARPVIDDYVDL